MKWGIVRVPGLEAMRRFVLVRQADPGGVSGTGDVAEGIVFSSGDVVLHWLRKPGGINLYRSLGDLLEVHGHYGQTRVRFIDRGSALRPGSDFAWQETIHPGTYQLEGGA